MRIRDNLGEVRRILSASPAVEERRVFNGKVRRNFEPCKTNGVEANAVIFFADNGHVLSGSTAQFAICNLTPESVEHILAELLQKGAVDLSVLKYQPKKPSDGEHIFDNGKSAAYWSDLATFSFLDISLSGDSYKAMQEHDEAIIMQEEEDEQK